MNSNAITSNLSTQNYGFTKKTTSEKTKTEVTSDNTKVSSLQETDYGKTIGNVKLSDDAKKYYEQLKKKYGNYDFVLVSEDEKANAQANAGKYANSFKTVVLIDEDKIERMATDESYRKKYEAILSGAGSQLEQMKNSITSTGAKVQGYGIQVNDGGTTSFFAVLKKSSADQKSRIEKASEKKQTEKKETAKKAKKEQQEERLEKLRESNIDDALEEASDEEDTIVITASSIEELINKISDYTFAEKSDNIQTESEMLVGQNIDFRG